MCLNKSMDKAKAFPLNAKNTNEFLPIFSRKLKGNKLEIMYIVNIPKRDNMMKKQGKNNNYKQNETPYLNSIA